MFEALMELLKNNPQIAGALTLVVGASISYFVRDLPVRLFKFIKDQSVCTLELDNTSEWGGKDVLFGLFMEWYPRNSIKWMSRSFKLTPEGTLVAGTGNQYFMFKRRLFWFSISQLESSGVHFRKQVITIQCLSRNTALIREMVAAATYTPPGEVKTVIEVYTISKNRDTYGWVAIGAHPIKRDMIPLLNEGVYFVIKDSLERFRTTEKWFTDNTVSYKRTYMFSGPPGTGKSTLAVQISMITARDIYVLDLSAVDGTDLPVLVGAIPSGSILLIEDVHGISSLLKQDPSEDGRTSAVGYGPDLSAILNVLCGIVPLNNIITIMTTNYKEKLEPALYRPGRVDVDVVIGYLDNQAINSWLDRTYGRQVALQHLMKDFPDNLTTGEVYRLYELHRDDHESVVRGLLEYEYKELGNGSTEDGPKDAELPDTLFGDNLSRKSHTRRVQFN